MIGFALLAFLLCLSACSDRGYDEPVVPPSAKPEVNNPTITLESSIQTNGLSFDSSTSEKSISFSATANWTLSIAESRNGTSWCTASPTSGDKGATTVKFKTTENTEPEDRSVTATIKAGTTSKTFTITQKGIKKGLYLPRGTEFNTIISKYLENNANLKKIKFIAYSDKPSETILVCDENNSKGYIIVNGEWLEIHTSAEEFIANEDCSWMFSGVTSTNFTPFISICVIDFGENFNTSNVNNMQSMFSSCSAIKELNLSKFTTNKVNNMDDMFFACENLTKLNINHFDTENVTSMQFMFSNCTSIEKIDIGHFDTKNTTNMSYMFSQCENLKVLDVSKFKTENVKDMEAMFNFCKSLTSLDVSNFKTRNVINMNAMFSQCENLKVLDVSKFETENVKDMKAMFQSCKSLASLDVSNFKTRNVTNMSYMFSQCENLKVLDISKFETENVKDMNAMFQSCKSLVSLDIENFNTKNVTNMSYMFSQCENLKVLDISKFKSEKVGSMKMMFFHCRNITSLDLANFSFENNTIVTEMFSEVGINAIKHPIPIKVTENAYIYLSKSDCNINKSAKFVKPDGTDW